MLGKKLVDEHQEGDDAHQSADCTPRLREGGSAEGYRVR
jgi:hypothetical protein